MNRATVTHTQNLLAAHNPWSIEERRDILARLDQVWQNDAKRSKRIVDVLFAGGAAAVGYSMIATMVAEQALTTPLLAIAIIGTACALGGLWMATRRTDLQWERDRWTYEAGDAPLTDKELHALQARLEQHPFARGRLRCWQDRNLVIRQRDQEAVFHYLRTCGHNVPDRPLSYLDMMLGATQPTTTTL